METKEEKCIICGKKFFKAVKKKNSKSKSTSRSLNCKTCSKKCSLEYHHKKC